MSAAYDKNFQESQRAMVLTPIVALIRYKKGDYSQHIIDK